MKKTYITPALSLVKARATELIAHSFATNTGDNSLDKDDQPMGGSGALVNKLWDEDNDKDGSCAKVRGCANQISGSSGIGRTASPLLL